MKTTKSFRINYKILFLSAFCILLLAGILIASFFILQEKKSAAAKQEFLECLSAESYDSIFLSMHSIHTYSQEDFSTYRGFTPVFSPYEISSLEEIAEYLEVALLSGNPLSTISLGLDPYLIWQALEPNQTTWHNYLEDYLLKYMDAYPEITFEIMLAHPSLEYWTNTPAEVCNMSLSAYRKLIYILEPYENVITFFPGAEHWLIANSDNYENDFITNSQVSKALMLQAFCDLNLQISTENCDFILNQLQICIENERNSPTTYPDLTNWQLVFFGDSVVGNYTGSTSIPGVVTALSHAKTYNFAIGGTEATYTKDISSSFLPVLNSFLSHELTITQDGTNFEHNDIAEDQQLCFVLHYGLNDYFTGKPINNPDNPYDIYTYAGALRSGIQQIQEAYPHATILLLTPPYCTYFSYGQEINSSQGGILTDYVEAIAQVADDMNVYYLNNYTGLGIDETNHLIYLADGCHLNETGRFLMSTHIIDFLKEH